MMLRVDNRRAAGRLLGIALVGMFIPLAGMQGAVPSAPIAFSPLDGGMPVLPGMLVTALVALPNGTVYAGGRAMVKSAYAFANPPVVPAGSVWLVSHDRGVHWTRHVSTTNVAVVQRAASGAFAWTDHHTWPADFTVNAMVAEPHHPGTIYAAGCTGTGALCLRTAGQHRLLRSTDGGATWADAIVFHTKALLYTGLANLTTNIAKTLALDAVLKLGPSQLPGQALDVAIDPSNGRRVYACMSGIGVLHSDDGARTWRYSDAPQFGWENVQCDLLIDPRIPAVVYAVDRVNGRIYRSVNGGRTWAQTSDFGYRSNQHLDNPTLVHGLLYITGNDGIYVSGDRGQHWRLAIPSPMAGTMVEGIRGSGGWIAAFGPTARTAATGVYGKRDGQPWQLLVNTNTYGPAHLDGAMDYDVMQGNAYTRLWVERRTRLVFTAGAIGGLWRWRSGI